MEIEKTSDDTECDFDIDLQRDDLSEYDYTEGEGNDTVYDNL